MGRQAGHGGGQGLARQGRCEINIFDIPRSAVRHLAELLANDLDNAPLAAGEIVSTGTLTQALPVKPGETWMTKLSGISLDEISLRFV